MSIGEVPTSYGFIRILMILGAVLFIKLVIITKKKETA